MYYAPPDSIPGAGKVFGPEQAGKMNFIRPEIRRQAWRWRESLIGGAVACLGLYMALTGHGVVWAVGTTVAVIGALLIFAGIQRARFRRGHGGPGLVHVDEGQVIYFGPHDGGVVSIDALERVELEPKARPAGAWVLTEPGAQPLEIPTNAENAEVLFDVFAALEGLQTEKLLAQLRASPNERVTVWQSSGRRLH